MPESYREKRNHYPMTLSQAHELGYYLRTSCGRCRRKYVYDPGDLVRLFGDVNAASVAARSTCAGCRSREFFIVEFWYPTGAEKVGLKVRRLVSVRWVRRIVWNFD
jgi:hypothetical protein